MSDLAISAAKTASILTGEQSKKTARRIFMFVCSPLALAVLLLFLLASETAGHNGQTVDACFYGPQFSEKVPAEFQSYVSSVQLIFTALDSAVAEVNRQANGGSGLDAARVKAAYFALFFGKDGLPASNASRFVNCFVRYEQVEVEVTDESGGTHTETRAVAVPIADMETVYANITAAFGTSVSEDDRKNTDAIYARVQPGGDIFSGVIERGDGAGTSVDVSLSNSAGKNSADLVAYAVNAWQSGWGYVWGTVGDVLTESDFRSKLAQYPDGVGKYADFIKSHWVGRRTTDCVGLIKSYGWYDPASGAIRYGTNGMPDITDDQMYTAAKEKGPISTMPDIPGLAVWHHGHIGVYIGNGEVIEAMGTKYGVVKTKLADRSFTAWLKIPYISYN